MYIRKRALNSGYSFAAQFTTPYYREKKSWGALPDVIFEARFSYLLYEIAHNKPLMISFMIPMVPILLVLTFHYVAVYIVASLLCFFGFFNFICAFVHGSFNKPISNQSLQTKLLLEVITRKPTVVSEDWRTIAYNMNQYLFNQELWNTSYYFYCGRTCHRYLLKLLVGKSFDVHSLSSTSPIMGGCTAGGANHFWSWPRFSNVPV